MNDKVVDLNGEPVEPDVEYDVALLDILRLTMERVKSGKCNGIAVIELGPHETGFLIECNYHGPRLSLLAGATRLAYKLNQHLDGRPSE